ncbi:glycoside hydrolase superfamily [Plectosphaerella plurivora]|uniref:Beta-xylanase n=1 Tax=Plectosphaerella plurivora TaxID=936078 RepID=A0A9P8V781_9PEZI|nr:glycoside hydrolase superfamily [Plectosphaerella plurivora]
MKNVNIAALATLLFGASTSAADCSTTPSLKTLAAKKNILIGSGAINPTYLEDPKFASTLAEQFESLSPENEMKWVFLNPSPGVYDWSKIDRLVEFADEHDIVVKGHGLISVCCNPDYMLEITDPIEFRAAMKAHSEAVMHRYKGKVDRWDVVSEPLETMGGGVQANIFTNIFGDGYIAEAFRIAHEADPDAKLFLNENQVESLPGKRQELYELVSGLVADGVPVHGIALQMHITEVTPTPGVLTDMVNAYNALGLEVSIAELDVHTLTPSREAEIYSAVMEEAVSANISDISFWGFTDKHLYTWLPGAKPLIFDEEYNPKPSYCVTQESLE